ncbi:hypothetical protein [Micromonospora endolithica]|uniref:STAS domain-containing protein n=1 Tax=Micromonospora endolithica TaxID=230091 RepID=A0A3A9ZQV3_9ACTN|nr:hypothetical protein [Micromonospora endolithica]RKN50344.1 hypothetical protein D7223_00570 [Micromonospora endolithica]TWJ20995.1 hypothetical protein JD76_01095 [Micromonospora endolithica]
MDIAADRGVLRADYHDRGPGAHYVTLTGALLVRDARIAWLKPIWLPPVSSRTTLRACWPPPGPLRLAVDLTALRNLDCAALAVQLPVRDYASSLGQQIVITAAAGAPARVVRLSAVNPLLGYPALPPRPGGEDPTRSKAA